MVVIGGNAHDGRCAESARFYRDIFEAAQAPSWGPFTNLLLDGGVLIQFGSEFVSPGRLICGSAQWSIARARSRS